MQGTGGRGCAAAVDGAALSGRMEDAMGMLLRRMTLSAPATEAADALLEACGVVKGAVHRPALEDDLRRRMADAQDAYPSVRLDPVAVARFWGERLPRGVADPLAELDQLHLRDLFLAWACADRQSAALSAFDRELLDRAVRSARRASPDDAFLQDVRQSLRERLFVGAEGKKAKILEYSGRGPLARWLKVVALGAAVSLRRSRGQRPLSHDDEPLAELSMDSEAPELALFRGRYREEFRTAFTEALAALDRRERTLLRLHFLKRLTVDELAPMYQVHRATAARWVAAARKKLLTSTRERLARRLALSSGELDSAIRDLRSHLDVTLSRVFSAGTEEDVPGGD